MDMKGVDQIARDWIGKNWYFDIQRSHILVCNDTMTACRMLMNTSKIGIMVEVALDPTMGFGFSRELAKTSILRWDLDGQNVTAIATNRMKLHSDGGLALDLPRHLVYWMNANQQELSVTDYEGKKTTILRKQSEFGGIYHLKIFEDKILAGGYNVLTQFPKRNYSAPAKTWYMAKLLDFKPFSGHVQPYVPHPCSENNGGCEQICLVVFRADPKGRQAHAQCACSDGFVVSRYDIRRCQRYIACNTSGGRFQCATSGLCLDNWFRCNGLYDCHVNHEDGSHIEDKSDEEYCEDQMCPENQLRCHGGGSCIPLSWVCDSVMDCLDNSDENHCGTTRFSVAISSAFRVRSSVTATKIARMGVMKHRKYVLATHVLTFIVNAVMVAPVFISCVGVTSCLAAHLLPVKRSRQVSPNRQVWTRTGNQSLPPKAMK
jgi:hypothetical protein